MQQENAMILGQIIGIIIAFICAVLIGKDASSRAMNAWGWGIFTFVIMIIAVPIYLVVRKPRIES
jgi:MFS family permease